MQIDWKNWFDQGLPYDEFVNKYGNDNERSRWQSVYERIRLAPEQEELLKSFVREMNVLVLAATWCGDCVNQGPIYRRFEEANDRIQVRFLEQDEVPGTGHAQDQRRRPHPRRRLPERRFLRVRPPGRTAAVHVGS